MFHYQGLELVLQSVDFDDAGRQVHSANCSRHQNKVKDDALLNR